MRGWSNSDLGNAHLNGCFYGGLPKELLLQLAKIIGPAENNGLYHCQIPSQSSLEKPRKWILYCRVRNEDTFDEDDSIGNYGDGNDYDDYDDDDDFYCDPELTL